MTKILSNTWVRNVILLGLVAVINVLSFQYFFRIDLTEDQRYSIAESTKTLLDESDKEILIELTFDGRTSTEYQQLYRSVIETLDELKAYAGRDFDYIIKNPLDIENDSLQLATIQSLAQRGVKVRYHSSASDGEQKMQRVFPGALVHYGPSFYAVNFIKDGNNGIQENFDQSVNEVEYELALALNTLTDNKKRRLAFTEGHGELDFKNVFSVASEFVKYADVGHIDITQVPTIDSIDVLVVAQPKIPFADQDLYKLDQYIMNGGKVMFFIDELMLRSDSSGFVAKTYEHNLRPLLRQFGVRPEGNLVLDFLSEARPVQTANGKIEPLKYPFFPVLSNFSDHIATQNLNPILSQNIGTIDTVKAKGVKKTPLVFTSNYTKVKGGDLVAFNINEIRLSQNEEYYNQQNLPVAYLCEGEFRSLFEHRPAPANVSKKNFIPYTKSGQVLVFGDAEVIKNNIDRRTGQPLPAGQSIFGGEMVYANASFAGSILTYFLNENSVVNLKSKEIKPRPLDQFKIDESSERLKWQVINLVLPIVFVLIFAIVRGFLRKRKYA